jgi:hypothetical protein
MMLNSRLIRNLLPAVFTVVLSIAIEMPALGGSMTLRPRVKKGSKRIFTSFKIRTRSKTNDVVPPAGWGATQTGDRTWEVSGGEVGPGGSVPIDVNNPTGTARGRILGGDYKRPDGTTKWVGTCSDPVGWAVIHGGDEGTTYLGYPIPAGEWGYFYQMYNTLDVTYQTMETIINIDPATEPYNFSLVPVLETFEINPVPEFDLGDLVVPISIPDTTTEYELQHYMDEEDAIAPPGVQMDWVYDGAGNAIMIFLPFDPSIGLAPGQTGGICAYTSQLPPYFPDLENIESITDPLYGCPQDVIPVPMPPVQPMTIVPTAISFSQLDWYNPGDGSLVGPDSSWGRVDWDYDPDTLTTWYLTINASLTMGDPGVRIVDNVPLLKVDYDCPELLLTRSEAIFFDLNMLGVPAGQDITQLYFSYNVSYLAGAATIDPGPTTLPAAVSNRVELAGDTDTSPDTGPFMVPAAPAPPAPNGGPAAKVNATRDIKGVQEAKNKCFAGSCARSLGWLNRKYKLGMNKTGQQIYDDLIDSGVSKPGEAGTVSQRLARWIERKNKYAKEKSKNKIITKVWDGAGNVAPIPGVNEDTGDFGAWLKKEIKTEDVEIGYFWNGGAHAITVVGVYKKNGKTYIKYRDDEHQDTAAKGDSAVKHAEIYNKNGVYRFKSDSFKIYFGVSESVQPPAPGPTVTPAPSPLTCVTTWTDTGNYRIEISETPSFETLLESTPVSAFESEQIHEFPPEIRKLFFRMVRVIETPPECVE